MTDENVKTTINQRIIFLREAKGLSQAEFAKVLQVFPQQINHYEKSKASPAFKFLQKVLIVWPEVNMNWLISGVGKPFLS